MRTLLNFRLLLFLFLPYNFLYSETFELKKFFKKPTNKSDNHTMKGIDFIYLINLDERPEKFASCMEQLLPYGIHPYRFSAINGWDLSLVTLNDIGVKHKPDTMKQNLWGTHYSLYGDGKPEYEVMQTEDKTYFCHNMARGPIGIVLSHLSVLQDAYDSGYERILVMEDDIQVIKDPHLISTAVEKLDGVIGKDGWDILFTDKDTKDKKGNYISCYSYAPRPNFTPKDEGRFARRINLNEDFVRIGSRYGAYSMIVQRSGIKKILDFFNAYNVFLPYDMDFNLPDTIRLYTVSDDIISTQPEALSDNAQPEYQKKTETDLPNSLRMYMTMDDMISNQQESLFDNTNQPDQEKEALP